MDSATPKAEEILEAATKLMQKRGYSGFSFRDIASEVGIRSASIHYHFPTKGALALSATASYRQAFNEVLSGINDEHSNAIDKLSAYGGAFLTTLKVNKNACVCLCGMLAGESEVVPEDVRLEVEGFFDDHCTWLNRVICDGQSEGTLKSEINSREFAISFLSALEGAMILARSLKKTEILSDVLSQQLSLVELQR